MFGWFKKKQPPSGSIDVLGYDVLARASAMLDMQLFLCKADENKYRDFLHSKFARGYFVGFFDASLQRANIPVSGEDHLMQLISAGHTYLFQGDANRAGNYTLDSLSLQGDEEFDAAQAQGGSEYFDFLDEKIRNPMGLMNRFHGTSNAGA